jgi:1-deoxy-D-xylulose-5-phosphate reductoisomerase
MKRVILIGATGSIGRQTLDVVLSMPERFSLVGISAHSDEAGLLSAAARFPAARLCLSGAKPKSPLVGLSGAAGLEALIRDTDADILVNGAAGSGGLVPSIAALESGKDLALANKESVVMAWRLLKAAAESSGRKILPVDSEHAALFQLVGLIGAEGIDELTITASGGAFRDRPLSELARATADEAAAHPNWSMGRKITIDSATMANKGLEVIEAVRLFGFDSARVRVLIHPQSLVHALVRARDGSLYAQLSEPDMRVPIQNALTWPETIACPFGRLDLAGRSLEFRKPEEDRYPLLSLAYSAIEIGEGGTVAYNAADEIAVAAFERGQIGFLDIARVVERVLEKPWPSRFSELGSIFDADTAARDAASAAVREYSCC